MQKTLSFFTLVLQKRFSVFCNQKLQEIGLTQGQLHFILYLGKSPGCSTGQLIQDLHVDWGHAQRTITKLVEDDFVSKKKDERDRRASHLTLTPKGEAAFAVSHQVFADWDKAALTCLPPAQQQQLITLLETVAGAQNEIN